MSDSHKILYQDNLSNATEVNSSHVILGSLQNASLPYQRETITIQLEDMSHALVFGLKVFDDVENISPMSNLVATGPLEIQVTTEHPPQSTDDINVYLIIGITVPVAVIGIIVIIICCIVARKRRASHHAELSVRYSTHRESRTNKGYEV